MSKNEIARNMIDSGNLTKLAKESGSFGQINCCQSLYKLAQSPINCSIWTHCPQVYCHFKFILRLIHIQFALSNHFQPKMILHCFALFNVFIRLTIANKSTDRRRIKKRFSLKLQADLSSGIHSWSHLGIEPLARSNSLEFKSWFDFNFN